MKGRQAVTWWAVAATAALVLVSLVSVVLQGENNQDLALQLHDNQLQLAEHAAEGFDRGRKLLACGECGCGVACPGGGGATQINMVRTPL